MKVKQTSFGRTMYIPGTLREALDDAIRAEHQAWEEARFSTAMLLEAEKLFRERTEVIEAKLGVNRLTVEAIIERKLDEQWQNAVADCNYFIARGAFFAAMADAARARATEVQKMVD